jgi:5-methylcytosine-specific restriction endonuclease McrA
MTKLPSIKPARTKGSRALLREFVTANVGRTITSKELQAASGGASEWGRRLRELRDEEGYQVKSHKDDPDNLKPGEYRLDTLDRLSVSKRSVDYKLRAKVLAEAAGVCQWCGAVAGKPHPTDPSKTTVLQVSHIVDKAKGGTDTLGNLIGLCSFCNEGASVETREPPRDVHLYSQIRRATKDVQRAVYDRLRKQYGDD